MPGAVPIPRSDRLERMRKLHASNSGFLAAEIILVLLALGPGCAPGPTEPSLPPPSFGEHDSVFTDDQLRRVAYSSYSVPPGFYDEGPVTVQPYYVNTISVADPQHQPPFPWTELATEDTGQARAWAESTVANGSGIAFISTAPPTVTERYFHFAPDPGAGAYGVPMRVHRASYVSGILTHHSDSSCVLGAFRQHPVGSENVRLLAEYLWTHSSAVLGDKVLSVIPLETADDVDAAMFVVRTVRGDFGMHDAIRLSRLDYRVDKLSGEIRYTPTVIRQILGVKR